MDRHIRHLGQTLDQPTQLRSPADEVDPFVDDVLRQFWGGIGQAAEHRVQKHLDLLPKSKTDLVRGEDHGPGLASGDFASMGFRLRLPFIWEGRSDGDLERLAGSLTDGHAVLLTDVVLDCRVHVEPSAPDCPVGHDPAQ